MIQFVWFIPRGKVLKLKGFFRIFPDGECYKNEKEKEGNDNAFWLFNEHIKSECS